QGNFIGVNAAGTGIPFASGFFGVEIGGQHTEVNTIGGTAAGARNVIGGNSIGILMDDRSFDNIAQGNFVGLGADGVTAVGNRLQGIAVSDLSGSLTIIGNLIGGTVAGAGNTITNNGSAGIAVFS